MLEKNKLTVHHIEFMQCGGEGVEDNALVLCQKCHSSMHLLLDLLVLEGEDFEFLTTVYVHLFLKYQSDERLYKRFSINKFADGKDELAKKFLAYVECLPRLNKDLLWVYVFTTNHYTHKAFKSVFNHNINMRKLKTEIKQMKRAGELNNSAVYELTKPLLKAA